MEKGIVKFYDRQRAFGYIIMENNDEIYFHITSLLDQNDLPVGGEKVTFTVGANRQGQIALEVRR